MARASRKSVTGNANETFAHRLVEWQKRQGRHDLPWQRTRDAYRIWLSEIMLQQTQVTTVIPYYQRFLEHFSTVQALAQAPVETVLEHWAGLGYYARARNLHRCAQAVVRDHGGQFPVDPAQLAELPGIGRSTAAAISTFAYGTRAAILDGNVKRVLARCFGVEGFPGALAVERQLWTLAESLLPEYGLEAYTQGLMDLGATVCVRGKPDCASCPMQTTCVAKAGGRQAELPTARPRKAVPEREVAMVLLTDGDSLLLERRPSSGIWGGLLSLPEMAWAEADALAATHDCRIAARKELPPVKHVFTHFRLEMHILYCEVVRGAAGEGNAEALESRNRVWLDRAEVEKAALPAPIRRVLVG